MTPQRRSRLLLGGLAIAVVALILTAALSRTLPVLPSPETGALMTLATSRPAPTSTVQAAVATEVPTATPPVATLFPLIRAERVPAPTYTYRVVAAYPHDPSAFTQGLQWHEGNLYEGTGLYGRSSLRRVDLATGTVLQQVDLPAQYFGEGITVLGDRIFQLTWQEQTGFVYDRETFTQLGEFTYATEGWGLTYDGEHLLMSDGSATIYRLDPDSLDVVGQFDVRDGDTPVVRLNELEMVGGELFANIWQTDRIARIDPVDGQVTGWIDLSGLLAQSPFPISGPVDVLNGIAYDAATDRLWVTGKLWPALFEIELVTP
jgi:glutaminyl-peptide cyclotransferase